MKNKPDKIWLFRAYRSVEDYGEGKHFEQAFFEDFAALKRHSAMHASYYKNQHPGYNSTYATYESPI